jgi:uncharacterized membrane protein
LTILNKILLMLHFVGLAMGLAVPFANIAMAAVMSKAAPPEKAILGRFPLVMSKVGKIGLALLLVTGVTMVYTRWAGFSSMLWTFHVKITAVILLTIVIGYISMLERRIKKGDQSVLPRIQKAGKLAFALALVAIVFAVLTFN